MNKDLVCSITPLGNVGNQMLQIMVAKALEKRSGRVFSYNHLCPDFGYDFDKEAHEKILNSVDSIVLRDGDIKDIYLTAEKLKNKK